MFYFNLYGGRNIENRISNWEIENRPFCCNLKTTYHNVEKVHYRCRFSSYLPIHTVQQGNKEDFETILKYTISYQIIFVNLRKREKKIFFCLFLSQINNSCDFKSEGKSVINSFLIMLLHFLLLLFIIDVVIGWLREGGNVERYQNLIQPILT